jgi:hypothetical protein
MRYVMAIVAMLMLSIPLAAGVNDTDHHFSLRGSLGGGSLFWGYVSHGNSSADLGTGNTGVLGLAALYSWKFIAVEGDWQIGSITELKWKDKDEFGVEHEYKSKGSGYYSVFDLKLGVRLFTEEEDMGYTYFYGGGRFWSTERTEDSFSIDGVTYNTGATTRKGNGSGWIFGYRDFSTIGANDGFAIVIQSGLYFGKAPVDRFEQDGVKLTQSEKASITMGGELAGGIALQDIGFSIVGGFRGQINATTFNDTAAPDDEESVFGFGNVVFFAEAGMQF